MSTSRKRTAAIAGAVLLGATVALSGTTSAQASLGGSLPSGSVVCTERTRSDAGVASTATISFDFATP